MLGITQWRGLCVDRMLFLAHVRGAQDTDSLSIGGHETVFDPVVDHLDKMAGPVCAAVQIPLFGSAVQFLTARCVRYVAHTRCQSREDWIEMLDYVSFATNHHAVATLQAPDTTAGPHVHIMDTLRGEFL